MKSSVAHLGVYGHLGERVELILNAYLLERLERAIFNEPRWNLAPYLGYGSNIRVVADALEFTVYEN